MSKIAYIHNNGDVNFKRGTIAIGVPEKQDLTQLFISHGTCIALVVGAARLAKNKMFNKKLGRQYSEKMMIATKCDLTRVEIRGTKHVYHFKAWTANNCPEESKVQPLVFALSTTAESENVNIVYGFFEDSERS
jgi:hypothetical protein